MFAGGCHTSRPPPRSCTRPCFFVSSPCRLMPSGPRQKNTATGHIAASNFCMRILRNKYVVTGSGLAAGTVVAGTIATIAAGVFMARRMRKWWSIPDNAVVLLTGGSRGLGLALAKRFARRPVRLVLVARDRAELERDQAKVLADCKHVHSRDFYLIAADLLDTSECRRVVDETIARFGRIDVL